jgi:predicted DNA-binding transcriptional regulator AlpA
MPPSGTLPPFSPQFLIGEDHMATQRKSPLLTTAETAEMYRLKKHTLENMRWQGTGPPFRKIGGRVFYHRADLKQWLEQTRRRSSSGRKD